MNNKKIEEIIQFIFHKVIFGFLGWLLFSYIIARKGDLSISGAMGYIFMVVYSWFFFTTSKKSNWNIFKDKIGIIEIVIAVITMSLLAFIFGPADIFISYK